MEEGTKGREDMAQNATTPKRDLNEKEKEAGTPDPTKKKQNEAKNYDEMSTAEEEEPMTQGKEKRMREMHEEYKKLQTHLEVTRTKEDFTMMFILRDKETK